MARRRIVVGLAICASVYGGPEEGGWYYESGRPLPGARVFFNSDKAYAYLEELRAGIDRARKFRGVGVGGCGDDDGMSPGEMCGEGVEGVVQHQPNLPGRTLEAWPEYTPRYE